jgi:hypothetical protein
MLRGQAQARMEARLAERATKVRLGPGRVAKGLGVGLRTVALRTVALRMVVAATVAVLRTVAPWTAGLSMVAQ